jgi:ABC-type dipeptide/oligopeptide/nickel transport system permease component
MRSAERAGARRFSGRGLWLRALFLGLPLALLGFVLLLGALNWLVRPDLSTVPEARPAAEVAAGERARDVSFDASRPEALPRIERPVDVTLGRAAPRWPRGESPSLRELVQAGRLPAVAERVGPQPLVLARLIRWCIAGILLGFLILIGARHPFVARRLLILMPTLLVVSVVVFAVIELPVGDYLSARLLSYAETGDGNALQQTEELRKIFHFDDPIWRRYISWLGVPWFWTFNAADLGLLQGSLGRSIETSRPVNDIVGDRILLTVVISFATILFTWAVAIPIGVYSAVRQYSVGDYLFTFIGFLGMSVPPFLLALLLMLLAGVSGLFSPEYGAQPAWSWGKLLDLLKHVWIPVVVMGVSSTASLARVMRANLLDELKKPYVMTARARGVRPLRLLFKYPVRVALNPLVSGIGQLFPQLVSAGAIVGIVLSLPILGPLQIEALLMEDTYLAGSMLMVLSLLSVFGTLVADLLLLWLDPRVRYDQGAG